MEKPVSKFECLACGYTDYRMSNKPEGDLILESCPRCQGDMVVKERDNLPEKFEKVGELVNKYFKVWDFVASSENMEFLVEKEDQKEAFDNLLDDLREINRIAKMEREDGELKILVQDAPEIEESNVKINIILFLATIGTTFGVAGYWGLYRNVVQAALFSSSLLLILGAHELAHKVTTGKNKVEASWPYFLPIPHPLLGTLGAVIKNKSPIPNKEALVEIGASGPICGFILAIPITIIGLGFPQGAEFAIYENIFTEIPVPLIFSFIGEFIFGLDLAVVNPNPLAWAGFIGLLVTWLNLLPTGQLDGGHVARSLLSQEDHFLLTRIIGFSLIFIGFLAWTGFLILGLLVLFIVGSPHPGALDNVSDLANRQKKIAVAVLVIFILTLPVPIGVF